MQVHKSLNPSFPHSLRRKLTLRRSSGAHPDSRRARSPHVYHDIDMSSRVDWAALADAVLDQPATKPPRTMLLVEVPELQSSCVTHGERVFKVERHGETIRVRDVLHALDAFLHRRVPKSIASFARPEEMKKVHALPIPSTHVRHPSSSDELTPSSTEDAKTRLPLPLAVHDCGAPPVAISLPVCASLSTQSTPDRSNSTLESSASGGGGAGSAEGEAGSEADESVISRWLGKKRVLASIKRAENHDFKLIAKMKSVDAL